MPRSRSRSRSPATNRTAKPTRSRSRSPKKEEEDVYPSFLKKLNKNITRLSADGIAVIWPVLQKRVQELIDSKRMTQAPWVASAAPVIVAKSVIEEAKVERWVVVPKPPDTFGDGKGTKNVTDVYSMHLTDEFFLDGSRVYIKFKKEGYKYGHVRHTPETRRWRTFVPIVLDGTTQVRAERARFGFLQKLVKVDDAPKPSA